MSKLESWLEEVDTLLSALFVMDHHDTTDFNWTEAWDTGLTPKEAITAWVTNSLKQL